MFWMAGLSSRTLFSPSSLSYRLMRCTSANRSGRPPSCLESAWYQPLFAYTCTAPDADVDMQEAVKEELKAVTCT